MYKSNLKIKREEKGLSRSELSKLSGVGIRTIEAFEQGLRDINGARVVTVLSLADALECDVYEIVNPRGGQREPEQVELPSKIVIK